MLKSEKEILKFYKYRKRKKSRLEGTGQAVRSCALWACLWCDGDGMGIGAEGRGAAGRDQKVWAAVRRPVWADSKGGRAVYFQVYAPDVYAHKELRGMQINPRNARWQTW